MGLGQRTQNKLSPRVKLKLDFNLPRAIRRKRGKDEK
jgi:hypothetical protein